MTREELYEAVQTRVADEDLFAASAYVLGIGDTQAVVTAFEHLVLDCYHRAKSIEQALHFGSAGIHCCLAAALALDRKDAAAAREFHYAAKRMATNVASFTWPGWAEPGVTISPEQMRQGLMFARYSVRLLHELDPTAAQLAYTYWFLGAQLLAHRQYAEALGIFETAHAYSREDGGDPDGRLMLEGYMGLTLLLSGQEDSGEARLDAAVAALRASGSDDAQFYAAQLVTARTVFAPPAES